MVCPVDWMAYDKLYLQFVIWAEERKEKEVNDEMCSVLNNFQSLNDELVGTAAWWGCPYPK